VLETSVRRLPDLAVALAAALAAALTGWEVESTLWVRLVLVAAAMMLALAAAQQAPRALIAGLAVWLPALGLVRRLLDVSGGTAYDPLLLVEPLVLGALVFATANRMGAAPRTRLAGWVLVWEILCLVEVLNPLQGGLLVGAAGLLFLAVPTLAFWIGRRLADDATLRRVLRLTALLALLGALYGLVQTFGGLPSWDARWAATSGYAALEVGGVVRPFASFSSSAEYSVFLGFGIVVWVAAGLTSLRRLPLAIAAVGLLGAGVFYESSRGPIVALVVTVGVLLAARAHVNGAVAVAVGVASLALLPYLLPTIGTAAAGGQAAPLVAHQVQGLSHPFETQQSTLPTHLRMVESGLLSALRNPVGNGTGSVTLAGAKFDGANTGSAENDPANAAIALGAPGLVVSLALTALGLLAAFRIARRRHDLLGYAVLGVLLSSLFAWFNGGMYAVSWLCWLMLGWIDRQEAAPGWVEP
jgi:hypothetical protein